MSSFDLYQDLILDYARSTSGRGQIGNPTGRGQGRVASCGDHSLVTVRVENGMVVEAKVDCNGCVVSLASAAMLIESVEGKSLEEARSAVVAAIAVFRGEREVASYAVIEPLAGIHRLPSRLKCASLSWHAMLAALEESDSAN